MCSREREAAVRQRLIASLRDKGESDEQISALLDDPEHLAKRCAKGRLWLQAGWQSASRLESLTVGRAAFGLLSMGLATLRSSHPVCCNHAAGQTSWTGRFGAAWRRWMVAGWERRHMGVG